MANNTYRVIELVGSSPDGVDAAIQGAVQRASSTIRGVNWFEVSEIRGYIDSGQVAHYQVTLKVGFRMEDAAD